MSPSTFHEHQSQLKTLIDDALCIQVQSGDWPESLREAISYSLLANGKRLRPILTLIACEVCGGSVEAALPAACAIEMIHTYSLIHDDLPSMDDDDLRRGRPTSHIVFGEALATLAGDALLTLAFESLAAPKVSPKVVSDCVLILARSAGAAGMVGGQVLDLEAERGRFVARKRPTESKKPAVSNEMENVSAGENVVQNRETDNSASTQGSIRVEQLIQIHRMKTGALITAALELGAAVAQAPNEHRHRLKAFGQCVGLAFQIADDLLDVTGNDNKLGKETGRDNELGKLTYPSLVGMEESKARAHSLVAESHVALEIFDKTADSLRQLAQFIVERDH